MAAEKRLRGKAPLTLVRTTDGKVHYVYAGKPAPTNITAAERDRLVGRFLEEVDAPEEQPTGEEASSKASKKAAKKAAAAAAGGDAGSSSSDAGFDFSVGIPKVKAYVGDDKAKAEAGLKFEQAKPLDQQRTSLVTLLEKVANPGD